MGHGSMLKPRARNSVDFLVNVNDRETRCVNSTGANCSQGQAAFWYSQGCFIGCGKCDHTSGRSQVDLCGSGKVATVNDPLHRSVNRNATAGSIYDIYKHNPWRAPGNAPIADACGLAGGTPWAANVGEAGDYTTTKFSHHGMQGTDLKELPGVEPEVWKIGGRAEVGWQVRNNHGGGYQYRLCPLSEYEELVKNNKTGAELEACFQKTPLEFVQENQAILSKSKSGEVIKTLVKGTFVNEGTSPEGSTWSLIPIAPTLLGPRCICSSFNPDCGCDKNESHVGQWANETYCKPCPQTPGSDCSRCDNNDFPSFKPLCEGCQGVGPELTVQDELEVPKNLSPGRYILGWRYDCEATAQVWENCADIELQ
jgi:hypothetical protein